MVDCNMLDLIVHADRAVFVIEADGGSSSASGAWSRVFTTGSRGGDPVTIAAGIQVLGATGPG